MIKKIKQRYLTDCGIACLAMAACISYEEAYDTFKAVGLTAKRGRKPAYASNFKELMSALSHVGVHHKLKRFNSFDLLPSKSIIKVHKQKNGDWHWVFAGRNKDGELYLLDPATELLTFEKLPFDELCIDIKFYNPCGSYIELN